MMAAPYADYTIRVGDDGPREVYYDWNARETQLLRVHWRISRTPSRKEFVLRHLTGSNEHDRELALQGIDGLRERFRGMEDEGMVRRIMNREGRFWIYYAYFGTPIDDTDTQLELDRRELLPPRLSTAHYSLAS